MEPPLPEPQPGSGGRAQRDSSRASSSSSSASSAADSASRSPPASASAAAAAQQRSDTAQEATVAPASSSSSSSSALSSSSLSALSPSGSASQIAAAASVASTPSHSQPLSRASSGSISSGQSPQLPFSPPPSLSSLSSSSSSSPSPPSPLNSPTSSTVSSSATSASSASSSQSSSSSAAQGQCILFLGDLSRSVGEEDVRRLFISCGSVVSSDVKRDKVTGNNLGYGFVQMGSRAQAERAKRELNGRELEGRKLRIGWAQKNTTLFVGDLDGSVTSEELRAAFSPFGPVIEEETFVKSAGGKYGFVRFQSRSDAERAKAAMNKRTIGSRQCRIGWGDNNIQKHCIHVQFIPQPPPAAAAQPSLHSLITEAVLQQCFSRFGCISSISLPRSAGQRLKGFAFIHFAETEEGEQSAAAAVSTMTDSAVNGVRLKVSYGKRQLYPRYRGGRAGWTEQQPVGGHRGAQEGGGAGADNQYHSGGLPLHTGYAAPATAYSPSLSPATPPFHPYSAFVSPALQPRELSQLSSHMQPSSPLSLPLYPQQPSPSAWYLPLPHPHHAVSPVYLASSPYFTASQLHRDSPIPPALGLGPVHGGGMTAGAGGWWEYGGRGVLGDGGGGAAAAGGVVNSNLLLYQMAVLGGQQQQQQAVYGPGAARCSHPPHPSHPPQYFHASQQPQQPVSLPASALAVSTPPL